MKLDWIDNPNDKLRKIAKIFAKGLPVEDQEFGEAVEKYLAELNKLPKAKRSWLLTAYLWASKAPKEDREDLLQEFNLKLLELKPKSPKLAYSIVRCDWRDWWKKQFNRSQYDGGSLNRQVVGNDGETCELGELLVGECQFEFMTELLDFYQRMPEGIQKLVKKRLTGKGLGKSEKWTLDRYVNRNWQECLEVA